MLDCRGDKCVGPVLLQVIVDKGKGLAYPAGMESRIRKKVPFRIRLAGKIIGKYLSLGRKMDSFCRRCENRYYTRTWRDELDEESVRLLSLNADLKGTKTGKRCFVLGNGPSLKTENLGLLSKEDVFTVNQAARNPQFSLLKPVCHFWADPAFFVVDENQAEDRELINVMNSINTPGNKPLCFFPVVEKGFVKRFQLDETLRVRYFYSTRLITPDFSDEFDYTVRCPGFHGVVLWAIALAIYMGYSEIYVLGIDTTSLMVNMKSYLGQNDETDYAYGITANEQKRLSKMVRRQSLITQADSFIQSLQEYEILGRYCEARGIKLVNCSSTTLVDTLPRMSLSEVFANSPTLP